MFGIHNYAGFVAAVVLFQIVPGPGTKWSTPKLLKLRQLLF